MDVSRGALIEGERTRVLLSILRARLDDGRPRHRESVSFLKDE